MLGSAGSRVITALSRVIDDAGSGHYVDRLIDLIGAIVPHDIITVASYSKRHRPEFVAHRRFADEMVRRYRDTYHRVDPFDAFWRDEQRPGVVHLQSLATSGARTGRYVAEFLGPSRIRDEVGVLVSDGDDRCLGVFLDRSTHVFSAADVAALECNFPLIEALHRSHRRSHSPGSTSGTGPAGGRSGLPPTELWPELSARERQIVALILAGHPTVSIAKRLGIAVGTAKNHRLHIYAKLDITTERELFLQCSARQESVAGP